MSHRFPHADHLTNEEVDYELLIRGKRNVMATEPEAKYRLLRNLFHDDIREKRDYPSPYTIEQEFDYIAGKVYDLEKKLGRGVDDRVMSRLIHYAMRAARSQAPDARSEKMRRELCGSIREVLNRANGKKVTDEKKGRTKALDARRNLSTELDDANGGAVGGYSLEELQRGIAEALRRDPSSGAYPKQPPGNRDPAVTPKQSEDQALLERIASLERELAKARMEGSRQSAPPRVERIASEGGPTKFQKVREKPRERHSMIFPLDLNNPWAEQREQNRWDRYEPERVRRDLSRDRQGGDIGVDRRNRDRYSPDPDRERREHRPRHDRDASSRQRGDTGADRRDRNRFSPDPDSGRRDHRPRVERERWDSSDNDSSLTDDNVFSPHRRRDSRRERRISDAEIQNADRRMEKWHLTFSGDSRQRPLEDFLHKIRRLAHMDRIADDVLLQRIHTILRGEAYDWYLCYSDEFLTWEDFEERIRYMYGNPNKDQGNRQRIYQRKQHRNETFLSFKMEIERLNKLLTTPLDQHRLFEVIWDNMRPHYQSKLACKTVRDLRKLEYYAYRIDAYDPTFRQNRDVPARPPNRVHQIEVENRTSDESYSEAEEVNFIGRKGEQRRKPVESANLPAETRPVRQQPAHGTERLGPLCWNCRKAGHVWRHCSEEKRKVGKLSQECKNGNNRIPTDRDVPNEGFDDLLQKVCEVRVQTESCPHITVHIFDQVYDALLDSGASVSVTNIPDIAERNGLKLQTSPLKIVTADKTVHESLGYVQLPVRFRGVTNVLPILVVPQVSQNLILGYNFWRKFGIQPMIQGDNGFELITAIESTTQDITPAAGKSITTLPALKPMGPDETLDIPALELPEPSKTTPETVETEHDLTVEERESLVKVIKMFPCTTENRLGRTSLLKHEIVLREEAKPCRQPLYRCSPAVQAEMEAELERYKRMDAIEECTSEWASALVPVRKTNGKLRVCLDSRRINAWTKKDSYPMRNMGGIFHRLGKAKYYSVVDLKDAYFQIPLKEECRDYTAFRTPQGLFRFKVCPFGLTNAPFTMCRLMDRVIGFDLEPNVFVYLDDIVIATKTFEDHVRLLRTVAERLARANLTISLDKSRFCRKQVTYLGYLLTEEGVAIDNSRIAPILNYARPRNVKDIRRLLGLAGFYQRFIREYSRIVAPISDLLKKSRAKFVWTEAAEAAFGELKAALVSAPILGNPDFSLPFSIESDASDNAVGAALIQHHGNVPKVVAYFSKKLSSTQRKYASVEKECLGVLLAIEHFRHFVEGTRFKVVTDARGLLWLFSIGVESGNAKLLRWALKIQSYDIELEYRKGKSNILADCLSRSVETISVQAVDVEQQDLANKIQQEPAKYPDFRVANGEIWKFVKVDGGVEDPRFQWKRYPAKAERTEIVRTVHERAHLGFEKTLNAVRERFYWPYMSSEVKRICQTCLTCQMSKASNQNTTPPMANQKKIAQYPWQFLAMDYVGPLPTSGKNLNTCLLVVTDLFSKFVIVQPFRQATAESLVNFVENSLFLLFGVPEVILSDNGSQFTSSLINDLLTRYHATHWRTPNYHPQVNDTERVNRVITTAIRACIKKDHKEWANNLQQIANAVRNSVHEATHYTPYFVMFGRNMVSDGREYRHLRDAPTPSNDKIVDEEREKMLEDVRKNLKTAYEKHSSYYNLRSNANCPTYSVGEQVLKKNTEQSDKGKGFCAKLAPKYIPAVVDCLGKQSPHSGYAELGSNLIAQNWSSEENHEFGV
ncbi:uncharacterized protein LOC129717160 [Wyeomyia smithii]|uniref:uncharacterized protein LOC129717160 n=1 Tax=Wyeomyia smithii TaxID=174621 RepID=UPI00246802C3|nr:uncharacterized protein LOC129717160 [Wyeomyia smithii]